MARRSWQTSESCYRRGHLRTTLRETEGDGEALCTLTADLYYGKPSARCESDPFFSPHGADGKSEAREEDLAESWNDDATLEGEERESLAAELPLSLAGRTASLAYLVWRRKGMEACEEPCDTDSVGVRLRLTMAMEGEGEEPPGATPASPSKLALAEATFEASAFLGEEDWSPATESPLGNAGLPYLSRAREAFGESWRSTLDALARGEPEGLLESPLARGAAWLLAEAKVLCERPYRILHHVIVRVGATSERRHDEPAHGARLAVPARPGDALEVTFAFRRILHRATPRAVELLAVPDPDWRVEIEEPAYTGPIKTHCASADPGGDVHLAIQGSSPLALTYRADSTADLAATQTGTLVYRFGRLAEAWLDGDAPPSAPPIPDPCERESLARVLARDLAGRYDPDVDAFRGYPATTDRRPEPLARIWRAGALRLLPVPALAGVAPRTLALWEGLCRGHVPGLSGHPVLTRASYVSMPLSSLPYHGPVQDPTLPTVPVPRPRGVPRRDAPMPAAMATPTAKSPGQWWHLAGVLEALQAKDAASRASRARILAQKVRETPQPWGEFRTDLAKDPSICRRLIVHFNGASIHALAAVALLAACADSGEEDLLEAGLAQLEVLLSECDGDQASLGLLCDALPALEFATSLDIDGCRESRDEIEARLLSLLRARGPSRTMEDGLDVLDALSGGWVAALSEGA